MALICRAVGAGIPLSEALRSVARMHRTPSREEFVRVVNEVAIGQPLEDALWKLHERVGLPEYAFFAVTIGLQAQTGGSLVETLQNLQDIVRKRVALSKRGKALAAEARMSAMILGALPFCLGAYSSRFMQAGLPRFLFQHPDRQSPVAGCLWLSGDGHLGDASTDSPEPRAMTHDQLLVLSIYWRRYPGAGRGRIPAALPGSRVSRRLRAGSAGCAGRDSGATRSRARLWPTLLSSDAASGQCHARSDAVRPGCRSAGEDPGGGGP